MKLIKNLKEKIKRRRIRKGVEKGKLPHGRTVSVKQNENIPLSCGYVSFKGELYARIIRANGKIEDLGLICDKVVTTAFVNYLVDSLQNSTTSPMDVFKYHDAGTGVGDEAVGDTGLGTAWGGARVTGTQIEGATANIFKTVATITFNNTFAITEHGVFSASTSGTLMDRSKFTAINVVANDSIEFTYQLTCTAGG